MKHLALLLLLFSAAFAQNVPAPSEGDYVVHNYKFADGESLPDVRLHYSTYGTPRRDAHGRVTNAVLVLHGTGGSGKQFLRPQFAGVLFGSGQLLDASKYFIILPDNVGHGRSSKPSDGLHARFPDYAYADMVDLQHRLLTDGLQVNHLRLVMGTSMGCMHSWMWLENYPGFIDAAMPLACLPVEIAGRNRMWRKMLMDSIRTDPGYENGDYKQQPRGLVTALYMLVIAGSAPLPMQKEYSTRQQADAFLDQFVTARMASTDANDLLYAVDASRDYDPSARLGEITAPVMYVNSADDFINPPELGIAEQEIKQVKRGRFVLLPITPETRGHGTHTLAAVWQRYLADLLQESETPASPGETTTTPLPLRVRARQDVAVRHLRKQVNPVYPRDAKQNRVQGQVMVHVVVGTDGRVKNAEAVSGPKPLQSAAVDAVRQREFDPFSLNGQPVEFDTTLVINFSLAGR